VNQGDLKPGTAKVFEQRPNQFYAIPYDSKTDVYVLILRSRLLKTYSSHQPTKAILSLGSVRDKPDCGVIRQKVGRKKMEEARKLLNGAFYCFDTLLTEEAVIAGNPALASDSIIWPTWVDAHVGWYAATGEKRPVEKLVRNFALNERACDCIPWPLRSIAREDSVFDSFVREAAAGYPESKKIQWLLKGMETK
jgi:hypothetical protein